MSLSLVYILPEKRKVLAYLGGNFFSLDTNSVIGYLMDKTISISVSYDVRASCE